MKVELSLYAFELKNVAGAFKGTSDPYAIVTYIATQPGEAPQVLGKTEVVKNTLSPQWAKVFVVDNFELGKPMKVAVTIFDEVSKGDHKSMGSALFDVGAVLGARGSVKAQKLKVGGTLFCHVRKSEGTGFVRLCMKGIKLANVEGWIGKSDPFFEVSRKIDSAGAATWDNVYRSQAVKDNLSPVWDEVALNLSTICGGNLDLPLKITVYDFESQGDHVLMGEFQKSVNELVKASTHGSDDMSKAIPLVKKGKESGHILVTRADLEGIEKPKEAADLSNLMATNATISSPPASVANNKQAFVDYIRGGCSLNVVVAVDFTGSNGNPHQPGTLHYLHPEGEGMNDYEKAIKAIVGVLENYDTDRSYPVYGFGAKYNRVVNHCFICGEQPEMKGVAGVLKAYRHVFTTGLIMSSPTNFNEVIETAAARAQSAEAAAKARGEQAYTILLIVSDGAVSDVQATAECIRRVSDAPLSIVIVGVGTADFSDMQFLDDVSAGTGARDIAQFVQFNKYSSSSVDLTSATLNEIPGQLVGYFRSKGIPPLPPIMANRGEILVEEAEGEVDLSLEIKENEIVVTRGGRQHSSF